MNEIRLRLIEAEYGDWSAHFTPWIDSKRYKNIQIVHDESYTHAVLYNHGKLTKSLPKENVIGICTEPYALINPESVFPYAKDHIGTLFVHEKLPHYPTFCQEAQPYLGCARPIDKQVITPKTKFCSIIASNKTGLPGHIARHHLIRRILATDLPIDIYGRGIENFYRGDGRIKGTLPGDKNAAFLDYKYTIAIENAAHPCWVTEKYYDAIMAGCIPIYWGASEIDNLYGPECHVRMSQDMNLDSWLNTIKSVYNNGVPPKSIERGQAVIRETHNLAEFIWSYWNESCHRNRFVRK